MKKLQHLSKTKTVIIAILIVFLLITFTVLKINQGHKTARAEHAIAAFHSLQANNKILNFNDVVPVLGVLDRASNYNLQANELLHQGIKDYFIPLLSNLYQHNLTNNIGNPTVLYPLLKCYLMMGSKPHQDAAYFKDITDTLLTHVDQKTLNQLIDLSFAHHPTIQINQSLVGAAQGSFKSLSMEQQAYLILLSNHPNNVNPFGDAQLSYFDSHRIEIPDIYTAKNFNATKNKYIPETTNAVLKGDWVIGASKFADVDPKDVNKLIYNLYLTGYTNAWGSILSQVRFIPPKTLSAGNTMIQNFLSDDSQLQNLLGIVYQNTHMKPIQRLSISIAKLNYYYSLPPTSVNSIQSDLQNPTINNAFILKHLKSGDYQVLKFKGLLPQPIQNWMDQLSQTLWQLGLKQTQANLNHAWQLIIANYNQHIYGHYPFANDTHDTKIDSFDDFFNPNSDFSNFVKNKLMPFVNTQLPIWEWKTIPGFQPTTDLVDIQEVAATTKLFYQKGKLDIPYVLTAQQLSDTAKQFVFNNNGTFVLFTHENTPMASEFHWNGGDDDTITLAFRNYSDNIQKKSYHGPWALFHCFNDANITASSNSAVYNVIFQQPPMSATFKLSSTANLHVFVKGALALPKLPKKVFEGSE